MLTSLLNFDLELFFNVFIVLHDRFLFVNVSVFLNSEFHELLLLFTPVFDAGVCIITTLLLITDFSYFTNNVDCLPPYWLAVASVILWPL